MITSKEDALEYLSQFRGAKQVNKVDLETSIAILQKISADEGLLENELDKLIEFLTATKLASSIYINLFTCFVPHTKISNNSLKKLLSWFFIEVSSERITIAVEKKFIQWLTGIVFYELGDSDVIDSYYLSFLFLVNRPHMESSVCKLLCLISKPEDAKRWVVERVLQIQQINGPRAHTNSLLSQLKSFRPDAVPERVSIASMCYKNSVYDENLKKAHTRKLENEMCEKSQEVEALHWNTWRFYDEKSKWLSRLIPAVENMCFDTSLKLNENKAQSIMDLKTMTDLGAHLLHIKVPAQTLSLLANIAGYHFLAFSDETTKNRFSHRLYNTLNRVFLLELEPYSEKEKINFLKSIKGFQEYIHQGIPSVTTFLTHYLLIWDGYSFREEIFGLLEWYEVRNEEDLQKHVFPILRQVFISSGVHCKFIIIETMGKLIKNLFIMDKTEKNIFGNEYRECVLSKIYQAISNFVSSLVVNGLIWDTEKKTRNVLTAALNYYETCQAIEQAADLPVMVIMPPILVYKCLFTGSRLCLERLCFILLSSQMNSLERLHLLGVFEDFSSEVQQLNTYIMDLYRCLWANIGFCSDSQSFIFDDNIFCRMFWKFKDTYGAIMDKILSVEYNFSFCDTEPTGNREIMLSQIAEKYPSVFQLKQVVERQML